MLYRIQKDKLLHAIVGVVVYVLASFISPFVGILTVVIVAVGKELYDELKYGGFDWIDILATIVIPIVMFCKELLWQI